MESKLTFETIRIPAADLGGENPFPDLQSGGDIHADTQFDNSVPKRSALILTTARYRESCPTACRTNIIETKSLGKFLVWCWKTIAFGQCFFPSMAVSSGASTTRFIGVLSFMKSGLPTGQPSFAQRLDQRRRGMEYRYDWPHALHPFPAVRRNSPPEGRNPGPSDV